MQCHTPSDSTNRKMASPHYLQKYQLMNMGHIKDYFRVIYYLLGGGPTEDVWGVIRQTTLNGDEKNIERSEMKYLHVKALWWRNRKNTLKWGQ